MTAMHAHHRGATAARRRASRRRPGVPVASAAVLALVLAGCTGTDPGADGEAAQERPDADGADTDGADTDDAGSEQDGPSSEATVGEEAPEPLAVTEAEGTSDFARVEVTDLVRRGEVVTLQAVLVVGDEATEIGGTFNDGGADFGTIAGVSLVDFANGNRHLVYRDSEGTCLCSDLQGSHDAGARITVSARFPAPPEDVGAIDIEVPRFPPLADVPIREAS